MNSSHRPKALLLALGLCLLSPTTLAAQSEEALNLQIALGSAAKRLCSSVFVGQRTAEQVFSEELDNPALSGVDFDLSDDLVRASSAGMQVAALYRPRLGCTLLVDESDAALRQQFDADRLTAPGMHDPSLPWPLGEQVALPAQLDNIDLEAVNLAVAQAFEDMEPGQQIRTRAVLVVHRGSIIAEAYAPPFDASMPQLGWSMTKTVTAALAGILADEGRLDLAAPAPVPEWLAEDDPRREITLEQLLQMSSGLAFSEVYTAGSMSDVIRMLYTTGDTAGFAAAQALAQPPGTHFSYASGTTNIISRILREQFDDAHDYLNFAHERLLQPLGMHSAVIEPDEAGVYVGSSYMYATPRDWARFGLLYLQGGAWNGERILSEAFVQASLQPTPAAAQGNYGYQMWLNAGSDASGSNRPQPSLPANMYYLSGFEGQNILLFPDQELMVLRMGLTTSGPRPVWALAAAVLAALEP